MKKLFVAIAILAAASFSANAQFRAEVAGNFGWYAFEDYSMDSQIAPKLTAYYQVLDNGRDLGVEIGLGYTMYKAAADEKTTITVSNIQIPFRGTYEWQISNNLSLTPCVGFYLGYAVGGKTKTALGETSPFEGDAGMQRFDFGTDDEILFTIARKFDIGLGVQSGFLNICKDKNLEVNPLAFYIGVGYRF